jgi:ribonucleoside-triphosphate reductase (formate)
MLNIFSKFSDSFKNLYNSMDGKLLDLEGISEKHLDISLTSSRYFKEKILDMSVDENANFNEGYSYGSYISELSKSGTKLLGYYDLYTILSNNFGQDRANKIISSLWNGNLYFHDSTSIQIPYCWAYSAFLVLQGGNHWGQLRSFPPKRARSFIDQIKEVTIEMAQQVAGAVAIGDLFVCYSYFIQKENLDLSDRMVRKDIENDFQSLVHTLNKKLRPSHQSPFTNFSIFDRPNLDKLFGELIFPDGSKPDFDIVEEVQRIFCDWFCKGDPATGMPYRFPIVTLNIRIDDNKSVLDKKSLDYFSRINLDKACFNIYISSGNKIASCCRLTNDLDMIGCDSFGNGGVSLGSHRVVTINLARLGRRASSYNNLLNLLKEQLDDARDVLFAHRKLLEKRSSDGFLPFFNYGLMNMSRLFSTFGINGVYECLREIGYSILTDQGKQLAYDLLSEIKAYSAECSKKYNCPFNVEQVPAESLAVKFALKDQLLYGMDYKIYSNQFVPLWVDCDIVDRIFLDGAFSSVLTGGGISHLNIGERLITSEQMKKLVEYAIKSGCEHFAVNYNFCRCKNDHVTVAGPSSVCSICGNAIVEHYTRITGYFTPVSSWNRGRQSEHEKRVFKTTGKNSQTSDTDAPITEKITESFQHLPRESNKYDVFR